MAMITDAILGRLIDEMLDALFVMKDRAMKFRPTLVKLEATLQTVQSSNKQIDGLYKELDKPQDERKKLKDDMEEGMNLIQKCHKVPCWNFCYKADYQVKLEDLDVSIKSYYSFEMQGQILRTGLENQVILKQVQKIVVENVSTRTEIRGVCSPPNPPDFTVGLDLHVRALKLKLLNNHHPGSVLTVTGTRGLGKSTLAHKFCSDEDVKGKFKENIFYVSFAETPELNIIVQRLFKHNGCQVLDFQSVDDTVNQLENLLKQIGKNNPILLVLDDVLLESVSLVEKFAFHIPNYKILVTSRFKIKGFGQPYVLKPLTETEATSLFRHSASLNQNSSGIDDDVVKKIVKGCGGSPMALIVNGKSLSLEPAGTWRNRAKELSKGRSILASSNRVLTCLQKSLDDLNPKVAECFKDLSLFPEAQRIPAVALIDIWEELYDEDDDDTAMENVQELVNRNMVDIVVTRNIASGIVDYNYHYVTQHRLLRDLAILQTMQEKPEKRNRLVINVCGNNLPKWWTTQNEYHIAARMLSISTDEAFTSEWCNLQPTEVEVLVMNLREKKHSLPMFMKKMNKLKVLIITNYDFYRADLENFELLDDLTDLKRIRLEKVSIPFLSKTGVQLKNLQKVSFFMCNVNEAFKNSTIQVSQVLPNLEEMNIDYCDMAELPVGLSDIVSLKKLSITNCHKLSSLPEGIGNLVNLESMRLTSCTSLEELPDSMTNLHKLKFLDISDCVSLSNLPENVGELRNLENLNCRGCTRWTDLPYSITDLKGLRVVVCDEETKALWEPYKTELNDLRLQVAQVDFNLNWLL